MKTRRFRCVDCISVEKSGGYCVVEIKGDGDEPFCCPYNAQGEGREGKWTEIKPKGKRKVG